MLYFSFWVLFVGSSVREISWRDLGKRTGDVECRNYLKPPSNSSKNKFWICLGSQSTAHREYNILYLWPRSKCWVWANKANIQHAATKVTNIGYYIPCGLCFGYLSKFRIYFWRNLREVSDSCGIPRLLSSFPNLSNWFPELSCQQTEPRKRNKAYLWPRSKGWMRAVKRTFNL